MICYNTFHLFFVNLFASTQAKTTNNGRRIGSIYFPHHRGSIITDLAKLCWNVVKYVLRRYTRNRDFNEPLARNNIYIQVWEKSGDCWQFVLNTIGPCYDVLWCSVGNIWEFHYERGNKISRAELISSRITRYPTEKGILRMPENVFGKDRNKKRERKKHFLVLSSIWAWVYWPPEFLPFQKPGRSKRVLPFFECFYIRALPSTFRPLSPSVKKCPFWWTANSFSSKHSGNCRVIHC